MSDVIYGHHNIFILKCLNMASASCPQNHGVLQMNNLSNLTVSSQQGAVNSNVNLVDLGKKLLDASKNGETEEVKSLMQSGAPFTTDWLGTSPLHFAAQFGHTETAEVLLRAGISRDARTKVDRTPLHVAAQEGHLSIVSLLIMHGADVDAKDMLKMTPLHWALVRGHVDVAECLLSNGADVCIQSKFEKTPIDIAYDYGRMDIIPMLQKYVGVSRPKPEPKQPVQPVKMRPTVLPNKANRTTKLCRSQQISKPLFSPTNLANWQKALNFDNLKKIFSNLDPNLTDENLASTNPVLATLAALAASASSSSSSSSSPSYDAASLLQWLETHGNSMNNNNNPNENSNLFQSAIEGGQMISLTEAGKLALTSSKDESQTAVSSNSQNKSKIITIVTDNQQIPSVITNSQSASVSSNQESGEASSSSSSSNPNKLKKGQFKYSRVSSSSSSSSSSSNQKYLNSNSEVRQIVVSSKESLNHIIEIEKEKEKLQKELELVKKQAEDYKAKLIQKEKEAEKYKRQLDELLRIQN